MTSRPPVVSAATSEVSSVDDVIARLAGQRYLADASLATVLYLALRLGKPVLLEGEAGVGKTEVAKALAAVHAAEQAAEGTDPPGDLNATPEYKRHLARVLTRRALEAAAGA